eukprot:jgi/Ulvmu1/8410/UM042_0117.1
MRVLRSVCLAWLLSASCRAIRSLRSTSECVYIQRSAQVLSAFRSFTKGSLRFCLERDVHFNESGPLWIPDDTEVYFDCQDWSLHTWHARSGLRIGIGSTLAFNNCAVSTFCDWDTVTSLNDSSLMPHLFGNTPSSAVQATNSSIEYPCVLVEETVTLPALVTYGIGFNATVGPVVTVADATAAVQWDVDVLSPSGLGGGGLAYHFSNVTVWCGESFFTAQPARAAAQALWKQQGPLAPGPAGALPQGLVGFANTDAGPPPPTQAGAGSMHQVEAAGGGGGGGGGGSGGGSGDGGGGSGDGGGGSGDGGGGSGDGGGGSGDGGGGSGDGAPPAVFISLLAVASGVVVSGVVATALLICARSSSRRARRHSDIAASAPPPPSTHKSDGAARSLSSRVLTGLVTSATTGDPVSACASTCPDAAAAAAFSDGHSRTPSTVTASISSTSGSPRQPPWLARSDSGSSGGGGCAPSLPEAEGVVWAGFAAPTSTSGSESPVADVATRGGVDGGSGSGPVKAAVSAAVAEVQALVPELADDKLRIFSLVGRGGFATVYRGEWQGLPVAVKSIVFDSAHHGDGDGEPTAVFAREAAIATHLSHRNIVATYSHDVRTVDGASVHSSGGGAAGAAPFAGAAGFGGATGARRRTYAGVPAPGGGGFAGVLRFLLVQELCNGRTLREAVEAGAFRSERMPRRWSPVMGVLKDIAAGMAYVHSRQVCHGDLNPSNVLLKFDDSAYRALQPALNAGTASAKISDFGMSTCMRRDRSHASGVRQGTPFYTAPEVLRHQQLRQASDVFSFGVIMWELMAGRPVFTLRRTEAEADTESLETTSQSGELGRLLFAAAPEPPSAPRPVQDPHFPHLPASVPLTFTLTMTACLSERPADRPTFAQICTIFGDLCSEVARGYYINSAGMLQDMWAAQAMPAEVDATADLAALGPRPPPVPQTAAGAALHMPSTIPEEPEDTTLEPTSGTMVTPRTGHGGSTARGSTVRERERDRDRSIAEIVLEESISLTEALANVEMARAQSDESSLSQWLGDDGEGGSATLPLSETLMPAALLGPGVPWQLRRSENRGVLGFDEVGAARELPSPHRGFSDSEGSGPARRQRRPFPRNPGASTMSSGHEADEERSAGASSLGGGGGLGGASDLDGDGVGFLWNSSEDLLWSEDDRALLQLPSSVSHMRGWPDG